MNEELGLSATLFGIAAGVFFIGYLLASRWPSNLMLHRFGARRWIARILADLGHRRHRDGLRPGTPPCSSCCGSCWALPRRASSPASSCTWTYWFPGVAARPDDRVVHDRHPDLHGARFGGLDADHPELARAVRPVGLAGDVPRRGASRRSCWRSSWWFALTDRPSEATWMPRAEAEGVGSQAPRPRRPRSRRREPSSVWGQWKSKRALVLEWVLLRHRLRALRARLLPPDDRQGLLRAVTAPPSPRCSRA